MLRVAYVNLEGAEFGLVVGRENLELPLFATKGEQHERSRMVTHALFLLLLLR